MTNAITLSESASKIKGNFAPDIFLGFADVTSYIKIELFGWKRGCSVSFELEMPHNSSNPFWTGFTKFLQFFKNNKSPTICIISKSL